MKNDTSIAYACKSDYGTFEGFDAMLLVLFYAQRRRGLCQEINFSE